jgi:hypothetical protein
MELVTNLGPSQNFIVQVSNVIKTRDEEGPVPPVGVYNWNYIDLNIKPSYEQC